MATESSSFTGADENPLVENNGANDRWRTGDGASGAVQRASNTARAAAANQDDYATLTPARLTVGNDQYSQVKIAAYAASGNRFLAAHVRIKSVTDSDCYSVYATGAVYKLYKQVDNGTAISSTQLGANFGVPAANAVIKAQAVGTTIKAFIDGAQQESQTDATYTAGQPGIGFYVSDVTTTYLDDWEGGDVAAAPSVFPERLLLLGVGP